MSALSGIDPAELGSYITWLKQNESFEPFAYTDAAGVETIGYGTTNDVFINNLSAKEALSGISESTADSLLREDLDAMYSTLSNRMVNLGKDSLFATIPDRDKLMMLDYEYNVGSINKYPKMRDAILTGNWGVVDNEYERSYLNATTGNWMPLAKRNTMTFDYFIQDRLTP